jgi:hypothetical protein
MRYGHPKLALALAALALIVIGGAVGTYLLTRGPQRKSPPVLNEPTEARRVRELRPGPQPGFPVPKLKPEKHDN